VRVLLVQNMAGEGLGRFDRLLRAAGHDVSLLAAHAGAPFPSSEEPDAVITGGSSLAAYDWREHAFLREEAAFLLRAVEAGVPCLGVCFGAQFLAGLLGARVYRAHRSEVGAYEVSLTEEGMRDPVLAGFPPRFPVFHWHSDTFDLPPGAALLARGDGIRHQAFRLGQVVGVQFHPEVTERDVAGWAAADAPELRELGKTPAQVVAECRAIEADLERLAERLLGNFLATAR